MSMAINQGNFAEHFRGFMKSMGVYTRPAGIDVSVTPSQIAYDDTPVEKMRTLVSIPYIGEPSPVRNALLASGDGDLSAALTQVQGVADNAMGDIKYYRSIGESGRGFLVRTADIYSSTPRGRVDADREWQGYFKAALYYSACGAAIQRGRAIAEFKDAADAVDCRYSRALILELGAALFHKLSSDGQKFLLLFRISEDRNKDAAYDLATNAWQDLLDDDSNNAVERFAIIAQGIESSLVGDGRRRTSEPFLRASMKIQSQNPLRVMQDRMRIAWAMAADASVGDGGGWALVARYMGETVDRVRGADIISSAEFETLAGFQKLAGDYAVEAFLQGAGRLRAKHPRDEAWIRNL